MGRKLIDIVGQKFGKLTAANGIPLLRIKYDQLDDVNDIVLNFVNKCRGDKYVQCG